MQDTATFESSPQQSEQWRREAGGPSGRIQAVVRLDGPLDAPALAAALGRAVARHESLRTTFVRQAGLRIPVQVVQDDLEPDWDELDSQGRDENEVLDQALVQERGKAFDFERGPLLRALLIKLGADRHVLVLTISTLCADAASLQVLVSELAHHCGVPGDIIEQPLQYADFAAWQLELEASTDDEAKAAREQWRALSEASETAIPFTRAATGPFEPDAVSVSLSAAADPALVQAAWTALLARLSGEPTVVTAFLSADRRHDDLLGAIGALARPVPLRLGADGTTAFETLRGQVVAARGAAQTLQDYAPSEAALEPPLGFLDHDGYQGRAGEVSISLARIVATGHPWKLWLAYTRGDAEEAIVYFDPRSYERATVERLAAELSRVIEEAGAHPDVTVGALDLLGEHERDQLLNAFNDTARSVADGFVHQLVSTHAAADAEREAVVDERRGLTYSALETRSNQLAHHLRAVGIGLDDTVGLCTGRSVEMVIGLLGILKAGGAYVPLNPEHPPARLASQLATAGARASVTEQQMLGALADWEGQIICLDRDADSAAIDAEPETPPDVELAAHNLAYVIYTSGSTGEPKGVAVTHGNVSNYVADMTERLGALSAPLCFGMVTSISTDLGNTSVFGSLGSGGTLVLLSAAAAADGAALRLALQKAPIDVLKITPSHIAALLTGEDAAVLPGRTLVLGGERAPWDLVERIRAISSCEILNHYGPTETTIGCCTFAVTDGPGPYDPATVPIGRPIANTRCYVLDDLMAPAPIGVPGTLMVGGAGVAREYIGRPDLTREKFLRDPFSASPDARMYDTGDVVRWLPDGTLEFLGRFDDQVKIRGYRVEPAEVESALRSHPTVSDAVVLSTEAASGDRRLVAYCTPASTSSHELRTHLEGILPEVMVPSAIVTLEAMPRTPSGKVDRLSLPDPAEELEATRTTFTAPRTPVEVAIAAVWSETLGVERIGVEDDFFELGGHSLLATQVVAQVRSEFAVDLPLHSLFTCPTVELLADEIVRMMGTEENETANLLAELQGLSDEEAERLLAEEVMRADGDER